jgi:hypothetical protein
VEIPDQYVGWIVAAWGAVMGWLLNMQRQILARPTREENAAGAATVAASVKEQFDEIKRMLEKQNEQTALHRQLVGDSLAEIRTKVAVLRDRAGDDQLSETGAHRRRL